MRVTALLLGAYPPNPTRASGHRPSKRRGRPDGHVLDRDASRSCWRGWHGLEPRSWDPAFQADRDSPGARTLSASRSLPLMIPRKRRTTSGVLVGCSEFDREGLRRPRSSPTIATRSPRRSGLQQLRSNFRRCLAPIDGPAFRQPHSCHSLGDSRMELVEWSRRSSSDGTPATPGPGHPGRRRPARPRPMAHQGADVDERSTARRMTSFSRSVTGQLQVRWFRRRRCRHPSWNPPHARR